MWDCARNSCRIEPKSLGTGGAVPDPSLALLSSPPAKNAKPTPENIRLLRTWLDSITAYRTATAGRPWTFYEQIDSYLGPWGSSGYPIGYGKKYCILFSTDRPLNADRAGRLWIRRTLILLQEAIKAEVMRRFIQGNLAYLKESELRQVAFNSHPDAYTEGGLIMVTILSPELLPHVASIPAAEFSPVAQSFKASVIQLVLTTGLLVPQSLALLAANAAGPAHTRVLAHEMHADMQKLTAELELGRHLAEALRALRAGKADHVGLLDLLLASAMRPAWPNDSIASLARELVKEIQVRKTMVKERYRMETAGDPELLEAFRVFDRTAF